MIKTEILENGLVRTYSDTGRRCGGECRTGGG